MITDKSLTFADQVSVAAGVGTALIGDVADLDVGNRRMGSNYNTTIAITVTQAFAGGTTQFQLATDGAAAIATDGSATVHAATRAFPAAELVAGARINIPFPAGIPANERYLGILATVAGSAVSAGSISAALVLDAEDWEALPDAVN